MQKREEGSGTKCFETTGLIVRPLQASRASIEIFIPFYSTVGRLLPSHLDFIMSSMVSKDLASSDPPKQSRSVILHWRVPEEWADVLHEWVSRISLSILFSFSRRSAT